jgi:hypothetical protein
MTDISLIVSKGNIGDDSPHQVRSSVLLPWAFLKRILRISFPVTNYVFQDDRIHTLKEVRWIAEHWGKMGVVRTSWIIKRPSQSR